MNPRYNLYSSLVRVLLLLVAALTAGCMSLSESPYEEELLTLRVEVCYPEGYESYCREGVMVETTDIYTSASYALATDKRGVVEFKLPCGFYRIAVADDADEAIFNGSSDKVQLTDENRTLQLPLTYSKPGNIIIRELYCGGCSKAPYEGSYQSDRYFILHNNSHETEYLDGLAFGTLDPYNSNATSGNVWTTTDESGAILFREYAPVVDAVWQLPGSGSDFPLAPGEGAVVVINGAIDHTQQYPESVNLNHEEYFVCYNPTLFPNEIYHPTPGDKISKERYCKAFKVGQSKGYIVSINSPTLILFRAPDEVDLTAYLSDLSASTVTKPGASDLCYKVPWEWVLDGMEVFNGMATNNQKRLADEVDAGFVYLSGSSMGHTLHRHLDIEASQRAGYDIYLDTNNSSSDYYEREEQSLKVYE